MIITNNTDLPKPFVRMAESDYKPTPKRYSATTLLKPVREILLNRRYDSVLTRDCSEMIWLLFGKAVHKILEEYGTGENEFTEERLEVAMDSGYTVSGILDFYDIDKGEVADYKTASVWKVIYKDFEDWKKQGLIYAWLLRKNGLPCHKATFYALLKDHSAQKAKHEADYPKEPVYRVEFTITDEEIAEIERFITDKLELLRTYEDKPDDELPLCTLEERWNDGDKYAVMRKGVKRALRVLDSMEAAREYIADKGGDYIELRKGEDKKCNDYCQCATKCAYWRSMQAQANDVKESE